MCRESSFDVNLFKCITYFLGRSLRDFFPMMGPRDQIEKLQGGKIEAGSSCYLGRTTKPCTKGR